MELKTESINKINKAVREASFLSHGCDFEMEILQAND
jgi:hypothetical protein